MATMKLNYIMIGNMNLNKFYTLLNEVIYFKEVPKMEIMLVVILFVLLGVIWFFDQRDKEEYIRECIERGDIVIRIYKL